MDELSDMADLSQLTLNMRKTNGSMMNDESFSSDIPSSYRENYHDNSGSVFLPSHVASEVQDIGQVPSASLNDGVGGVLRSSRSLTEDVILSPEVYGDRFEQKMNEHHNAKLQAIKEKAALRRSVHSVSIAETTQRSVTGTTQRSVTGTTQRSVTGTTQRSVTGTTQRSVTGTTQRSVTGTTQRSVTGTTQRSVSLPYDYDDDDFDTEVKVNRGRTMRI